MALYGSPPIIPASSEEKHSEQPAGQQSAGDSEGASLREDIAPTLPPARTAGISVSVKTKSQRIKVGNIVECDITISNDDGEDYYMLTRETPLEGLRSDIFTVTRGRKKLQYDGIMLKRAPPTNDQSEYTIIKAKDTWKGTVDLSEAYYFTPGNYTLQLNMTAIFHKELSSDSTQAIVSNTTMFKLISTVSGELPKLTKGGLTRKKPLYKKIQPTGSPNPPELTGDYKDEKEEMDTIKAYNHAYTAIGKSIASTTTANDRMRMLYKEWFGNRRSGCLCRDNTKKVRTNYEKMRNRMERDQFTLHALGNGSSSREDTCVLGAYAFTYKNTSTIYLCSEYFRAPVVGTNSKMGIIVHELSHAAAGTDDIVVNGCEVYGQDKCRLLAETNAKQARQNADNYEYFTESQAQQLES